MDLFLRCPKCDAAVHVPESRFREFAVLLCPACKKYLDRRCTSSAPAPVAPITAAPSVEDLKLLGDLKIAWEPNRD